MLFEKWKNSSFSYLFEILHMCCYGQPDIPTNILHIDDLMNKTSAKKEDDDNFQDKKNNFNLGSLTQHAKLK